MSEYAGNFMGLLHIHLLFLLAQVSICKVIALCREQASQRILLVLLFFSGPLYTCLGKIL